jgi:ATP-binding cassette subfamily C (CFTR/MRP) protein 1
MRHADFIVSIDEGKIQESGSYAALVQGNGYFSRLKLPAEGLSDITYNADTGTQPVQSPPAPTSQASESRHTDIRRKNGERAVYMYYLEAANRKVVVLYIFSVILWVFCTEFSSKCEKV